MSSASSQWPIGLLFLSLGAFLIAGFLPWALFTRRFPAIAFIPPFVASVIWWVYEFRLNALSANVLIRIDLFILIPLAIGAWLSAAIAFFVSFSRDSTSDKWNPRDNLL